MRPPASGFGARPPPPPCPFFGDGGPMSSTLISVSFLASLGLVAGLRFGSSRVFPRAHIGQVPGSFCCCLFWAFVPRLASFRVPSTAFPKAALGPISRCALARALCSCRGSFWAHFRSVRRACWANCGILLSTCGANARSI